MAEARRRRKKKQQSEYFFRLQPACLLCCFLLGFGLIMIYSASSYEAVMDTYGDAAFYMKKQLVANIIGLVGMIDHC